MAQSKYGFTAVPEYAGGGGRGFGFSQGTPYVRSVPTSGVNKGRSVFTPANQPGFYEGQGPTRGFGHQPAISPGGAGMVFGAAGALQYYYDEFGRPIPVDGVWANPKYFSNAGFVHYKVCSPVDTACGPVSDFAFYRAAAQTPDCRSETGLCVPGFDYGSFPAMAALANQVGDWIGYVNRTNGAHFDALIWYKRVSFPAFVSTYPRKVPYVLPEPLVDPVTAPMVVPAVDPLRRLDPDGRYLRAPYIRRAVEAVLEGSPRVGVRPRWRRKPHKDVRDRSKKVRRAPAPLIAAIKLMHSSTELQDALRALVGAITVRAHRSGLGPGLVPSGNDIAGMLAFVAANWRMFGDPGTFSQAVTNLANNEVSDRVIGALLGSNWRTGVRSFNDQYSTSASITWGSSGGVHVTRYMRSM